MVEQKVGSNPISDEDSALALATVTLIVAIVGVVVVFFQLRAANDAIADSARWSYTALVFDDMGASIDDCLRERGQDWDSGLARAARTAMLEGLGDNEMTVANSHYQEFKNSLCLIAGRNLSEELPDELLDYNPDLFEGATASA